MLVSVRQINEPTRHVGVETRSAHGRLRRAAIATLTAVTLTNYAWQVPYAVHQYGLRWIGLPRLSMLLIITLAWFAAAIVLFTRNRRGGTALLASFLTTEALFYVVHNFTGAFGRDLPETNPVVLIASMLGYLNLAAAIAALAVLATRSRRRRVARNQVIATVPAEARSNVETNASVTQHAGESGDRQT